MPHIPVLLEQVIQYLKPKPGYRFIDATAGGGGHAQALAQRVAPDGKVLALDWDSRMVERLSTGLAKNIIPVHASYTELERLVSEYGFENCDGILFDLGMSSWHIEEAGRGFSFERDEPLDMRYDTTNGEMPNQTAKDIINAWPEHDIEKILKEYGEERFDGRIARAIASARKIKPILTTFELVEIIKKAVPFAYRHGRIHFATRTFQALRIAVNHELENVRKGLDAGLRVLKPGGILAVIAFHSLEDRIVKQYFREKKREGALHIVTKKPVRADLAEIEQNRRARSAKLRIAQKADESRSGG